MGIDPIGKTGGPGGISPSAASGVDGAGSLGSVDGPEEFSLSGAGKVDRAQEASPLDRLRSGELDLNGYLDVRVDQATAHLVDRIDGEKLAFIRSTLRSQLEQDPTLVELVRRATGAAQGAMQRG